MENLQGLRICPNCQVQKTSKDFYRHQHVCKECLLGKTLADSSTLHDAAERRKQEKILRQELKKIAKQRMAAKDQYKKKKKRQEATKALLPELVTEENQVEVDPAVKELARRALARRKLIEFIQQFHPRYKAGWVHHDICARLEKFAKDVDEGKSPRLMLLMPPRHGKSQIASKLYPAWHMGHYPHHEFIACSYNISLALEFSREVRDVVDSEPYKILFPGTKINEEIRSAETWKLVSPTGVGAGGYVAAGVGGGITGKGAHVLVIDDPVKNAEEAESPDIRQKIWNWYQSTAYTRLAPGGGVLIIQTCWHDDDLAGRIQRIMNDKDADEQVDQFEIVKYPAIANEDETYRSKGEALHTDRYDLEALLRIKRNIGDRHWSALYQQDPISNEGAYFTKDMFVIRDLDIPENFENMDVYQAWDFAISDKHLKQNNWTVGVTIAWDFDDQMHLMDVIRLKTSDYEHIEDEILSMYAKYPNIKGFGGEDGQIWRTMMHSLKKRMEERRIYIPLPDKNPLKPVTSKEVRARPLQARLQHKKITFPKKPYVDELIKEFLRFPMGAQDDQVDAMAWCVHLMLKNGPPLKPRGPKNRTEMTVQEQLKRLGRGNSNKNHMLA